MKVLVSDFDGTLFKTEEEIEKNKEAIDHFRKAGNLFVIATGRRLSYLLKDINRWNIPFDYLICNDGAMIFDKNLNCLDNRNIPKACNQKIIDLILTEDDQLEWYLDDGIHYTKDPNVSVNKVIIKIQKNKLEEKLLEKLTREIPEIHGYVSNHWINLISKDANKSRGIARLISLLFLGKEVVYTVGDNINDREMLKDYHGYVMQTASEQLSSEYPRVTSVFQLIEEIMRKG